MKLVDAKENEMKVGDKIVSFRGEYAVITGYREPQHIGSSGRVFVNWCETNQNGEYFPNVFNLKFVD